MDDKIAGFLKSLKTGLAGLPEAEAREALEYYEEYLCDAQEEGKDIGQVISHLDSPGRIAEVIKATTDIQRAESNPGVRNFNRAMKNGLVGITAPFSIFFISLFIIISYCVVGTFLAGALIFLTGAVVTAAAAFYEGFRIPIAFFPEMLGTLGAGLFIGGICMVFSIGFFRLAKVFIRMSARLIKRVFKRNNPSSGYIETPAKIQSKKIRRPVLAFGIIALLGLGMFSVSGLPYKFFVIFNSMKPENINLVTRDFDPAGINKISIVSAHSCIDVGYQDSEENKITVSYEQPDWLSYQLSANGSMLSFYEESSGLLPFFSLDTLHESRTLIKVLLPKGFSPDIIQLESRGGFITVNDVAENINVKTYTGKISLDEKEADLNLEAATETGRIEVNGQNMANKTQNGTEYYRNVDSDKTIRLTSSRGDITIQRQ